MAVTNLRLAAWLSCFVYFCAFVLFFVCYCGNSWYVVPNQLASYPPLGSSTYGPDNPLNVVRLGLFWMCIGDHCKYDLRVDYMVVGYIPFPDIQFAYQNYRTSVMAISTIAACFCLIGLALYFIFLSGFALSRYIGFAAGGISILAGVVEIASVVIFGVQFRGSTPMSPFGWCFGLMIVALIILIVIGILTILLSIVIHVRLQRVSRQSSAGKLNVAAEF